jgi:hypothetical protein
MFLTPVLYPVASTGFSFASALNPISPVLDTTRLQLLSGTPEYFGRFFLSAGLATAALMVGWLICECVGLIGHNGSVLEFSKSEIDAKFDAVVDFAELRDANRVVNFQQASLVLRSLSESLSARIEMTRS